jgi:hypothetical protein
MYFDFVAAAKKQFVPKQFEESTLVLNFVIVTKPASDVGSCCLWQMFKPTL